LPMTVPDIDRVTGDKLSMPIFMAHGAIDEVIRVEYAEQSRDKLNARDAKVEWHKYDIAHSVSNEEVDDLSLWFKRLFGM